MSKKSRDKDSFICTILMTLAQLETQQDNETHQWGAQMGLLSWTPPEAPSLRFNCGKGEICKQDCQLAYIQLHAFNQNTPTYIHKKRMFSLCEKIYFYVSNVGRSLQSSHLIGSSQANKMWAALN